MEPDSSVRKKTPKKRYKKNNGEQETKNTWTSDEEYMTLQLKSTTHSKDHKTPKIYKPTDRVSMYTESEIEMEVEGDEEIMKSTERMRRLSIDEDFQPNFALASDTMNSHPKVNSAISFNQRPLDQWNQFYGENNSRSSTSTKEEILQDIQARAKDPLVKTLNKRNIPSKEEYFRKDDSNEKFGNAPQEYRLYRDLGLYEFYSRYEEISRRGRKTISHAKIDWKNTPLEQVDAIYCTDFLRESRPEFHERDCYFGRQCIFMHLGLIYPDSVGDLNDASPSNTFIGREFLLPSQLERWRTLNELPANRNPCLGCNRIMTTFMVRQNEIKRTIPHTIFQDHMYLVTSHYSQSDRAAYNISNCLVPAREGNWNGIVAPFVEFNANNYVYSRIEKPCSPYSSNTREYKCVIEKNLNFQ